MEYNTHTHAMEYNNIHYNYNGIQYTNSMEDVASLLKSI